MPLAGSAGACGATGARGGARAGPAQCSPARRLDASSCDVSSLSSGEEDERLRRYRTASLHPPPLHQVPYSVFIYLMGVNEQAYHLMVSNFHHPWTSAIPEETQVRCEPFKKEYVVFLVGLN